MAALGSHRVMAAALAVSALACSDGDGEPDAASDPELVSLISHSQWAIVSEADDPLADHRPDEVDCPEDAVKVESLGGEISYGVHTVQCNYLAASQPSRADVPAGATVTARVWHFALDPPDGEPGEAHVALLLGDELIWEEYVEIPSAGGLLQAQWQAPDDIPEGTEIIYHLHNHGDNEWNLIEILAEIP